MSSASIGIPILFQLVTFNIRYDDSTPSIGMRKSNLLFGLIAPRFFILASRGTHFLSMMMYVIALYINSSGLSFSIVPPISYRPSAPNPIWNRRLIVDFAKLEQLITRSINNNFFSFSVLYFYLKHHFINTFLTQI